MDTTYDPLAGADFRLDELRDRSACPNCGEREPMRLDEGGCESCREFLTCGVCSRWVGTDEGWLPGYRWVDDDQGQSMRICDVCWKGAA